MSDIFYLLQTTPSMQENAPPTDLLQAQLRDQKNKAVKFEAVRKSIHSKNFLPIYSVNKNIHFYIAK